MRAADLPCSSTIFCLVVNNSVREESRSFLSLSISERTMSDPFLPDPNVLDKSFWSFLRSSTTNSDCNKLVPRLFTFSFAFANSCRSLKVSGDRLGFTGGRSIARFAFITSAIRLRGLAFEAIVGFPADKTGCPMFLENSSFAMAKRFSLAFTSD